MYQTMLSRTTLREWQFDEKRNFTFKKRQGPPFIVPTDQVRKKIEKKINKCKYFSCQGYYKQRMKQKACITIVLLLCVIRRL